jgi:hypothetical protein
MKKSIREEKERLCNQKLKISKKKIGAKSYSILVMNKAAQILIKIRKSGKRCQKKKERKELNIYGQKHEPTTNDFVSK